MGSRNIQGFALVRAVLLAYVAASLWQVLINLVGPVAQMRDVRL